MSSLIGHALIGSAIIAGNQKINSAKTLFIIVFFSGIGISPDIDYIIFWLFKFQLEPRLTHSITYCLMIGLLATGIKQFALKNALSAVPTRLFFIAAFSHLILDILVGVHPMPLLWPIDSRLIVLPFGILPSAGRMSLQNLYFWRNLLIELGILIPSAAMIVPRYREALVRRHKTSGILFLGVFIVCVLIGFNLRR